MKDDEYTRMVVALDVRARHNPAARQKLQSVMRSLLRPDAKGFTDYLTSSAIFSSILDANGGPMGQSIEVDKARIHRTGLRIMRGLYFIERGKPIPKDAVLRVGCLLELGVSDADGKTILDAFRSFPERRGRTVGEAFSYVAGFGDQMSAWLMLLYGCCVWMVTTDERETSEQEKDAVLVNAR